MHTLGMRENKMYYSGASIQGGDIPWARVSVSAEGRMGYNLPDRKSNV